MALNPDEVFLVTKFVLQTAFGGRKLGVAEVAAENVSVVGRGGGKRRDLDFRFVAPRYHRHARVPLIGVRRE